MSGATHQTIRVGWREWVRMPSAGVPWIKTKIDTGARSSAVHAFDLERFERDGEPWVRFSIHPWQRSDDEAREPYQPSFRCQDRDALRGREQRRQQGRLRVLRGGEHDSEDAEQNIGILHAVEELPGRERRSTPA